MKYLPWKCRVTLKDTTTKGVYMDHWISPEPTKFECERPLFLCVLSNTDTASIPGISAAGKSPRLIDYTPAGDAELVTLGQTVCNAEPPMTDQSPTPAVITRAAMQLTYLGGRRGPPSVVPCPSIPLLDVGALPGRDIRTAQAVPDVSKIYANALEMGRQIRKLSDLVIIGESIPGGTTTAMGVLQAMGINGRVSSSNSLNPLDIKAHVVSEAFSKAGVLFGDMAHDPMGAIEHFGDPMMPCVCGLMDGLEDTRIVLAGGTQMMAVLCLLDGLGISGNISIATTKFVAEDGTASFVETVSDLGFESYIADPGFDRSRHKGLRMYESGVIKEGVGAGGAMFLAGLMGIRQKEFREQVELVCDQVL